MASTPAVAGCLSLFRRHLSARATDSRARSDDYAPGNHGQRGLVPTDSQLPFPPSTTAPTTASRAIVASGPLCLTGCSRIGYVANPVVFLSTIYILSLSWVYTSFPSSVHRKP